MSKQRRASKQKKDEQGSVLRKPKPARARTSGSARLTPSGLPPELLEAGNTAVSQLLSGLRSGRPLDQTVRNEMEQAFGADFSEVRIHDDADARARASEISADAFAHGEDIYLSDEASSAGTVEGKSLIAHELAHVVQQRRSGGQQPSAVGSPGDRFEADADKAAAQVGAGRPAEVSATGAPPAVTAPARRKGAGRQGARLHIGERHQLLE